MKLLTTTQHKFNQAVRHLDFLPLLSVRLYLAPVMISAGLNKLNSFTDVATWFGNPDWGLGLPMPLLMAGLATFAELIGGLALLIGFGTRWFSIPLIVTMLVAMWTVHWQHGWFAITPTEPSSSTAVLFDKLGFSSATESLTNSTAAAERLEAARSILQTHGHYDWLTETGNFVILNNGIEFAATYLIMLLVLLCYGAGRYASVDYWLAKRFNSPLNTKPPTLNATAQR